MQKRLGKVAGASSSKRLRFVVGKGVRGGRKYRQLDAIDLLTKPAGQAQTVFAAFERKIHQDDGQLGRVKAELGASFFGGTGAEHAIPALENSPHVIESVEIVFNDQDSWFRRCVAETLHSNCYLRTLLQSDRSLKSRKHALIGIDWL